MARAKVKAAEKHPLKILAGATLCLLAAYLALCLSTYNQADPSVNHAVNNPVTNAGGHSGAVIANLALQLLGLASILFICVPIAWGIKMLRGNSVSYLWLRFVLLLVSVVFATGLLSLVEPPLSWPISSGFGGSIGNIMHEAFYKILKSKIFVAGTGIITLVMISLAFGMSWDEWKIVARRMKEGCLFACGVAISLIPRRHDDDDEEEENEWMERGASFIDRIAFWRRDDDDELDDAESEEDDVKKEKKPAAKQPPRVSKKDAKDEKAAKPKKQATMSLSQGDYELPPLKLLSPAPKSKKNVAVGDSFRVVQFTPPGSPASIHFGKGLTSAAPGAAQLYLVVSDIEAARAELVERGANVSEVIHRDGPGQPPLSGRDPARRSYVSVASFSDPDGNSWLLQEVTVRLPGRVDSKETTFSSPAELAGALRRAAAAHGEHEKRTGAADPNWPDWYAEYVTAAQSGRELPK